ncbi:uncharacterized protein LOC134267914 [Saccostrea cucullata]|uniref:uncharacterized protein LOC134267914 n=1 Tax=Saccostrea cuccullata TaxID=36930 RepID=UPI002ED33160
MRDNAKKNLLNSPAKIERRKQQLDSAIKELELKMEEPDKSIEDILAFNDDNWKTNCYGRNFTSFAIIDDSVDKMMSEKRSELEDFIGTVFQETYGKFYPERVIEEKEMLKSIQVKEINTEVEFLMDIVCAPRGAMIFSAQNNASLFRIERERKSVLPCLGYNPEYIAISPSSDVLLFTSLKDLFKTTIAGNMKPEKFGKLDSFWDLNGLTFSDNEHVYLCLKSEKEKRGAVVCLNMSGDNVGEYFQNKKGDNLFVNPIYIAENKMSDCDICVSDNYSEVRCIKKNKEKRFVYKGVGKEDLNLRGIDCDRYGNIIVSDFRNNNLHIVNKRGICIRRVGEDSLCKPTGLCIDLQGNIWVAEYEGGKIKVIEKCAEHIISR